ncbi:autotransporter outer membrane beta-barrel domain-containing protein [Yersinia canariae]|nr:autotransporter outer membrane beta-barrel domain-containing protein [Yersinia canariae]
MYILNIFHLNKNQKILQLCTKTISALLLVLSSNASWADSFDDVLAEINSKAQSITKTQEALQQTAIVAQEITELNSAGKFSDIMPATQSISGLNVPPKKLIDGMGNSLSAISKLLPEAYQKLSYQAELIALKSRYLSGRHIHQIDTEMMPALEAALAHEVTGLNNADKFSYIPAIPTAQNTSSLDVAATAIVMAEMFSDLPEMVNSLSEISEFIRSIQPPLQHIHQIDTEVMPALEAAGQQVNKLAQTPGGLLQTVVAARKIAGLNSADKIASNAPTQQINGNNMTITNAKEAKESPKALSVSKPTNNVEDMAKPVLASPPKVTVSPKDKTTSKPTPKTTPKPVSKPTPKPTPKRASRPVSKPALVISHTPQAGSYIANQIAAQQMFITDDLHYRQRETHYIDPVTGEKKVSSMWLNTSGAKNRFNSGNNQLQTRSHRYAIQLGGTLSQWSSDGSDLGILGITSGLGKSTNHSHSTSPRHKAQGSVDGYNLGLYHIWYADNQTRLGPYIDLLTQYGWFNNQVKTSQIASNSSYRSHVFTSALETGYKIQLVENTDTRLFIQPKAKVSWQRMSGVQYKESAGTQVMMAESSAVATKLGIRTALELDIDTLSSNKTLQISPSFEANWIHNSNNKGIWFGTTNITPQGNSNIADFKLGIEANIDSNLRLWTHLGHQLGGNNYSDMQATLGANYCF